MCRIVRDSYSEVPELNIGSKSKRFESYITIIESDPVGIIGYNVF
jgi:hypothetical protein